MQTQQVQRQSQQKASTGRSTAEGQQAAKSRYTMMPAMRSEFQSPDWKAFWHKIYSMFSHTVSGGKQHLAPAAKQSPAAQKVAASGHSKTVPAKVFKKGAVVAAHSGLRLRAQPVQDNKKGHILKVVPYMSPVEILQKHVPGHAGWVKVQLESGEQGYMSAGYLKFMSHEAAKSGAHAGAGGASHTTPAGPSSKSEAASKAGAASQTQSPASPNKTGGSTKSPKGMHPASQFTLSESGANAIAKYESFKPRPYNDPSGYATIGYGHLLHKSNVTAADRKKWGSITKKRALELLRHDAARVEALIHRRVKVPITQSMFDALVSFGYNVGGGNLAKSTLLKKLNRKDYKGAANEFGKWTKSKGKRLPGLVRRRAGEKALFCQDGC